MWKNLCNLVPWVLSRTDIGNTGRPLFAWADCATICCYCSRHSVLHIKDQCCFQVWKVLNACIPFNNQQEATYVVAKWAFFEECLANRWYVSRRRLIGILFFLHINAGIKLHKVCVFMLSLLGMLKRYGCQARGKEEDHRQAERRGRLSESS